MKYKLGLASLAILILLSIVFLIKVSTRSGLWENGLRTEIFIDEGGYGYRIWAQEQLMVQQDVIPGISGNIPFQSSKEAQKVADFVKSRLEEHKDPRVQKADLEKMAINIPTLDR